MHIELFSFLRNQPDFGITLVQRKEFFTLASDSKTLMWTPVLISSSNCY